MSSTLGLASSKAAHLPASSLIEWIAAKASSSVFIYDLAEHVDFGHVTNEISKSEPHAASVVRLQTRAGAGMTLAGRLSTEGTSKDATVDSIVTAFNTPSGLAAMVHAFSFVAPPTAHSRLVIQVPVVTPVGQSLSLAPTLAPFAPLLNTLPETFSVLLSETPQEAIELATVAYETTTTHVIHFFNFHSSTREIGHVVPQPFPSKAGEPKTVENALSDAGYGFFDYAGDNDAQEVVVMLNGPLAAFAKALAARTTGFGVLVVRLWRPWNENDFIAAIPKSTKTLHVVDEVPLLSSQGTLYGDVISSSLEFDVPPSVIPLRLTPDKVLEFNTSPTSFVKYLSGVTHVAQKSFDVLNNGNLKRMVFFGTSSTTLAGLPQQIAKTFADNHALKSRLLTDHDAFSKPGGVTATRLLLSPKDDVQEHIPIPLLSPYTPDDYAAPEGFTTDFLAILDTSLLQTHELLGSLKRGAILLLFTSWSAQELVSNMNLHDFKILRSRDVRVFTIDTKGLSETHGFVEVTSQLAIGHLAFLKLYLGARATAGIAQKLIGAVYRGELTDSQLQTLPTAVWSGLEEIDLSQIGLDIPNVDDVIRKSFEFNSVKVDPLASSTAGARLGSWHEAAKRIMFPEPFQHKLYPLTEEEIYPQVPSLRPENPDRTYLITCSVNRRLTPLDYDRNVFHLEFDTRGTGLRYEIGEALGIHGWNDTDEVHDFCSWYGVDPNKLITIPIPRLDGEVYTRTVFQALQQQIDIFGKPPKSFYSDLAQFATTKEDKLSLQFIGSPEGSSTFKKLSEKDTVTFADVLKKYSSARPSIEVLCEMIEEIKPRHYSIASAQSVVGDRVDLLVVTVDWVTPTGSPRYGQCTRYLAGLKLGQQVTVSIKPSVMKLPPDDMQPMILAGLGTGAAPFRAFLQHRAMLSAQGIPVGPLYYYFGSRYRTKEYLYGEEIEAFILGNVITKAGLAFSRDDKKKVYIQHKMLEDSEALAKMLYKENGVFYLCGPTWPVPDVYEALVNALNKYVGMDVKAAGDYLEGLKEEERYVLEVY